MKNNKTNEGFVVKILLIIVAIVILKYYFDFDILEYLKSPQAQKVIVPVWGAIKSVYFWVDEIVRGWVK